MRKLKLLLLCLAAVLVTAGCTVRQDIGIKSGNGGEVFVDLELNPVFVKYINDLSEATGKSASEGIFNTEDISSAISGYPDTEPVSVVSPEESRLKLIIRSGDFTRVLPSEYAPILKFEDSDGERKVTFHLGADNYEAIDMVFGISGNPVLSALAPQTDNPYTGEEYTALIDYVFSDYLDNSTTAEQIVESSYVQLNIRAPGNIISADMGEYKGNLLKVKIPAVRFLTLEKPVDFSFKYSI